LCAIALREMDSKTRAELKASRIMLVERKFIGANLQEIILHGALLQDAEFTSADLTSADLSEAHLEGANLSKSTLKNARLWRGRLDSRTDWKGCRWWLANFANPDGDNDVDVALVRKLKDSVAEEMPSDRRQWSASVQKALGNTEP